MRQLFMALASVSVLVASTAVSVLPAAACAGLIGSNGAVNLGRTTTLAAYHDGVEHYVTAFKFQGGGGQFGTLIPLPGIPSSVEKGGGWTLQRLILETEPPVLRALASPASAGFADEAQVLMQVRVDALDITILKGGSREVATWALGHGFRLSPDAPEVLEFYARRSPIFLAAVFDGDAANERGQAIGDGTPVQITIPTTNPWVPLHILGLGKQGTDRVEADVFLLTDRQPAFIPSPGPGFGLAHNQPATTRLLDDLRSDERMEWVPETAWLTKLRLDTQASNIAYDLAVDASGQGTPSRVAAGLEVAAMPIPVESLGGAGVLGLVLLGVPIAIALRRQEHGA